MAYSTYIQNFVDKVAAYVRRAGSTFTVGTNSIDLCLGAMNDARKLAQQKFDWEGLKTIGAIHLNGSSGAPWAKSSDATYGPFATDSVSSTALQLKSIDMMFNYAKDASGVMQPTNVIAIDNARWFRRLLPTNMGFPFDQLYPQNPPFYYNTIPSSQMFAYIVGPNIFVNTCNAPTWFMIFGQQQLPDLAGTETTDFFIDNYPTWLLYATIQQLNFFLTEDQRVQISAAAVQTAWDAATFDDGKKGYMGNDWVSLN